MNEDLNARNAVIEEKERILTTETEKFEIRDKNVREKECKKFFLNIIEIYLG